MNNARTAREEMLSRIREALQDVPGQEQPEEVPLERKYYLSDTSPREEIIARFVERVAEYKASVWRIQEGELPSAVAAACARHTIRRLVVPGDIPATWLPGDAEQLRDEGRSLTYEQLDQSDGVLTGCALAIAQTGTIILDGGKMQGRRVLSLLPDYALCVIWEEQIVGLVPEAIRRLDAGHAGRRPLTFISGPSATSDIELSRVEGVHGPRTLEVLVVSRASA
jgi:L-lactate dehydrogenase complex protein LldG